MKRKWMSLLMAASLAIGMFFAPVQAAAAEPDPLEARQDFYEAVNAEDIAEMTIPADASSTGQFQEIQNKIDAELEALITGYAANLNELDENSVEYQLGAIYLCATDTAARDAYGYGPTMEGYLARIEAASDVEELLDICMELAGTYGIGTLFGASYGPDLKNVEENVLYVQSLSLPLSKAYWLGTDESSSSIRQLYLWLLSSLYQINGKSEAEADALSAQLGTLYTALAPAQLNPEEYYDPETIYNVYTVADLPGFFHGNLSLETFCRLFEADRDDKVIIQEPAWMMSVGNLMTEENLPLLKELTVSTIFVGLAGVTDMQSLDVVLTYNQKAGGAEEKESLEKDAMSTAISMLPDFASRVYAENFASDEIKEEVEAMTEEILAVLRGRILNLDWMQEETKQEAVKKIDSMTVNAAYPDEWPEYMDAVRIVSPSEGGNLVDNYLNILSVGMRENIVSKDEPADGKSWDGITTYEVNAFYSPSTNSIFLPVAILQGVFYGKDASEAENLGGIGTVIGHEITHAFDNSGAQYDEKGNFENWWTQKDYEMFARLSRQVVDYYNGFENNGMQVNGEQTLGENIADLGGVAAVTQLAVTKGLDLSEVYEQYASIWAGKETPEYAYMLMLMDTHSPDSVRVNAVLSAMPEFYEVYGVLPGDGMYQAPENRPGIW